MGIREDIDILESRVARLKVEYEQYFTRVLKREPSRLRDEVERIILLYSNQNITNTALKFRFHSIVSKYNSYKQYWTRVLRSIEDGSYSRRAEGMDLPRADAPRTAPPDTSGGQKTDEVMHRVFDQYIETRRACHEPTDGITFEALKKSLDQQLEKVEALYRTRDVEYRVYVKDGKAKLAIVPKKK